MGRKVLINRIKPIDLFKVDITRFPQETAKLLSMDFMSEYQLLPLGIRIKPRVFDKIRVLNIGTPEPRKIKTYIAPVNIELDKTELGRSVQGVQFYRLSQEDLAAAFVEYYKIEHSELQGQMKVAYERYLQKTDDSGEFAKPQDS